MATNDTISAAQFTASLSQLDYSNKIASIKSRYTHESWVAERDELLASFPSEVSPAAFADFCLTLGLPGPTGPRGEFYYPEYTPAWSVAQRLAQRIPQPVRTAVAHPVRASRMVRCIDCEREFMSYGETGLDVQCGRCS